MSEENGYKDADLLVIITRLHAYRDSRDDEFKHDWSLPESRPERAGLLRDARDNRVAGFWMLSESGKAGLLVVHGHNRLLDKNKGTFQNKVLELIRQANIFGNKFSRLAIFAHGTIPEAIPVCIDALRGVFASVLPINGYSTDGNKPVAMALPDRLKVVGINETLRKMVADRLKLEPAVDRIVRGMQHILLEMRLWCDLWFAKNAECDEEKGLNDTEGLSKANIEAEKISASIQDCVERLINAEHWRSPVLKERLSATRGKNLKDVLCEEGDSDLIGTFFEDGTLWRRITDRVLLDDVLRRCSARVEQLIIDAAEEDKKRVAS